MRISRLVIQRYGPLKSLDYSLDGAVQLVYGLNESGKTLMVDFLIKMLTGKNTFSDPKLNRIPDKPEGFLEFEEDGKTFKLGEGETLVDRLNITPQEFRNVFVVRDADLQITEEEKIYRDVTGKVGGLRFKEIQTIIDKARDLGHLTERLEQISNSPEHHRASSNLKDAKQLGKEIRAYNDTAEEKGYSKLESRILELRWKKRRLALNRTMLQKAREREEFNTLSRAILNFSDVQGKLNSLPNDKQLQTLHNELERFNDDKATGPYLERTRALIRSTSYVGLTFFFLITIGTMLMRLIDFASLAILSLVIAFAITIASQFWLYWKLRKTARRQRALLASASEIGIDCADIESLGKSLARTESQKQTQTTQLDETRGLLKNLLSGSKRTDDAELLKRAKEELEAKRPVVDFRHRIHFDADKLRGIEKEIDETDKQLDNLEKEKKEHDGKLRDFSKRTKSIDFEHHLGQPLDTEIDNLESLGIASKSLDDLVRAIETNSELSRTAISVLNEMLQDEEQRVERLFGEESSVSTTFRAITKGRYKAVVYDSASQTLHVLLEDGTSLNPEELSKGTRDQLYFTVRVSLGTALLKGKPGFFIMDDAFMSSDEERLQQQLKLVKQLADAGWQTIYFTPHRNTAEAFERITKTQPILLKPLES